MKASDFDEAYFERFYFNPRTRVADPGYFDRLGRFVGSYLHLLDCDVRRVLDAGCGPGLMHASLRDAFPGVTIEAFDHSEYICERYGWKLGSIETYSSSRRFDLVVCHDVLQYLNRPRAAAAIETLSGLTRCALFFGVLTREDWQQHCDKELTDADVHLRSAAWYRRQLARDFRNAGGGLYLRRDAPVTLFELEHV